MEDISRTHEQLLASLEALLFYYGESLTRSRIATFLNISAHDCDALITDYETALEKNERGLTLLHESGTVRLVTKPSVRAICEALVKEEFRETLTPAALETLSIIAYLGPVARSTVDYIRGVNSSFTVRSLLMRGLIERDHDHGHAYLYRASKDFLSHMGLRHIEDLPEYARFQNILREFESSATENNAVTNE